MADDRKPEDKTAHKEGDAEANPVYLNTGNRPPLKRVYLYRVMSHTEVLTYETDRPQAVAYGDMESEIDEILKEIAAGDLDPVGTWPGGLNWKKRNYFVVVYEDPNDSMRPGNAVTFKATVGGGNHTFHDGKDILIQGKVRRFFCINQMRKKEGGDLGDRITERFKVTINHLRRSAKILDKLGVMFDHTATGTNTGPP